MRDGECIRHHHDTAGRLTRGNQAFNFVHVANGCVTRFNTKRHRGGFKGAPEGSDEGCRSRVEHQVDAADARRDLLQQLDPLAAQRTYDRCEAGGVAAGLREARDVATTTGSATSRKTIGMVRVCCNITPVASVLLVRIKSGRRATSSCADRFINSTSACDQRISISMLWPSV